MSNKRGRPVGSFKHSYPAKIGGKATKCYSAWQAMIQRCTNPNSCSFKWYGERGISVCERWLESYGNFVEDMGVPLPGFSLDRIDNASGYSKDNCRWATQAEQCRNRRPKTRNPDSLMAKAFAAGLPYSTVYQRVKFNGWSEERALTTPKLPAGRPRSAR